MQERTSRFTAFHDSACLRLLREHPLLDPPQLGQGLRELREIIGLG